MMASLATDFGVTLVPFRQIYGERGITLLADTFFTTLDQRGKAPAVDLDQLAMPTVVQMPDRAQFDTALARWEDDMAFDSLPDEMKEHESFREVIQQGKQVVPLIAAHLRRSPSFLFLALEEIFGEDPVPEEAYGNLKATVSSWLQWLQR
jgi:hypothetical protein